jgi:hypothetical protein
LNIGGLTGRGRLMPCDDLFDAQGTRARDADSFCKTISCVAPRAHQQHVVQWQTVDG